MGLAWSLPTGFDTPITYFYVVYFAVLLIHRQRRDDEACEKKCVGRSLLGFLFSVSTVYADCVVFVSTGTAKTGKHTRNLSHTALYHISTEGFINGTYSLRAVQLYMVWATAPNGHLGHGVLGLIRSIYEI